MTAIVLRDDFVKERWLSKGPKTWRKRWFVLTPQYLCSFKAQGDYRAPTETIRLRECSTVKSSEEVTGKENSFQVETPGRVFFICADSPQEKEAWIGSIGRHMIRTTVLQEEYEG